MNRSPTLALIDEFLRDNAWTPHDSTDRYLRYRASSDLGLSESFELFVPAREDLPGASDQLRRVVEMLASLHEISADQLGIVLAVPDTIVSVQISNSSTIYGAIPLSQFETVVERIRRALRHTAAFVLTDSPLLEETEPDEADDYLAQCQFLQTERGSFVAKVQLPSGQTLAEPSFFKPTPVTSDVVNTKFQDVVDFAVNTVLEGDPKQIQTDEVLETRSDVVNVNVLDDLAYLFERTTASSVNIGFLSAKQRRLFQSGLLADKRLQRLQDFTSFARTHFSAQFPLDFRGKIVELRSRNPKGNRNHVLLHGLFEGKPTYVSLSLPQMDYWHATQAHSQGKFIRVAGFARHMKTQVKLMSRELFQILDD